jgi:hypothetical protein
MKEDEIGGICRMHGEMRNTYMENLKVRDHSEDLGVDGKVILEGILRKLGGKVWTGYMWLRVGTSSVNKMRNFLNS